ncbi:CLUMA_CG006431, isoform A [Clunio marinus]|uniref:CLUMA_CG006431, isoform A n=1 Tax=Clunio marinus TaxID=568069 RepID=A0A1J1HXQ0_9DIPT|nr:CLUMA_CG006431, isoform A [Clunio marinus]
MADILQCAIFRSTRQESRRREKERKLHHPQPDKNVTQILSGVSHALDFCLLTNSLRQYFQFEASSLRLVVRLVARAMK